MSIKGLSLIELSVVGLLSAFLILGAIYAFELMTRSSNRFQAFTNRESSLLTASKFIERLGRVATECEKLIDATERKDILQCSVNFTTGTTTTVRFIQAVESGLNVLRYENLVDGVWTLVLSYPHIAVFRVCTGNEMQSGTCPIEPLGLNNVVATASSRIFRYELISDAVSLGQKSLHGAFYVRNPTPFPGIVYQWGG